jgi:hypothetical protein
LYLREARKLKKWFHLNKASFALVDWSVVLIAGTSAAVMSDEKNLSAVTFR